MKKNKIQCNVHGEQETAFVCQHIAASLETRSRVGFCWSAEDDSSRPDAWCIECNERVKKTNWEWTGEAAEHLGVKLLCGKCYDEAKNFNLGGPLTGYIVTKGNNN